MRPWRRLSWQIAGANMVVVVVGVTLVLAMAFVLTRVVVPEEVRRGIALVLAAEEPAALDRATATLLDAFRQSILTSVSVAAAGAVVAGLATSLWLARQIARPLRQIIASSRRIADGRYDERVPIPDTIELRRLATDFNQMAAALEEVEQQRITLIGNVTHELRTPLAGLQGYVEGLQDGLFADRDETLALMAAEVERLRRLVEDLQALSRVEGGHIPLEVETIDAVALVDRVLASFAGQRGNRRMTRTVAGNEAPVMVQAAPDRAAQILINLIGNAIRYTADDGQVKVHIASDGDKVEIAVQDDGIGVPAEALPYLFERFYRVDRSRARKSGGSGIGLTIARHLARAMGGDVTAASEGEGLGSVFTVVLPGAASGQ